MKAVKQSFSHMAIGTNYPLQVSGDFNTWTNQGLPFNIRRKLLQASGGFDNGMSGIWELSRHANRAEFTRHRNYEMHHCFIRATCFLLGNDGLVCSGYFYQQ
jgi:hypothetical protein